MNAPIVVGLVLLSTYAASSLILSIIVLALWPRAARRPVTHPNELLTLRLLPSIGAALVVLTVVCPAFLLYEPREEAEHVGMVVVAASGVGIFMIAGGFLRGWRAWARGRALLLSGKQLGRWRNAGSWPVLVLDIAYPIVAVIGTWKPSIVASSSVVAACDSEEFHQIVAHEAAHVATHDNLKLLCVLASPDLIGWTPLGDAIVNRWRLAAEYAADERAAGAERDRRVELASALLKVARLTVGGAHRPRMLGMSVAVDDVEGRVRRLLQPAQTNPAMSVLWPVALTAVIVPLASVPIYEPIHRLIELLIALGR